MSSHETVAIQCIDEAVFLRDDLVAGSEGASIVPGHLCQTVTSVSALTANCRSDPSECDYSSE